MKFNRYDYASYWLMIAYSAASVIIPMTLCNIAIDLGFPLDAGGLAAGGALQIGRAIPMVAAMLFCGIMAARMGMRRLLRYAMLAISAGILAASLSNHYIVLFAVLAIAGCGEGIVEGITTPFVQQLHEESPGNYISIAHSFWSVGILFTTLIAGLLLIAGVHWRWLVAGCAILGLPAILLLGDSRKTSYPERKVQYSSIVVMRQTREILVHPRFWLFFVIMIFAGGGEYGITFWAASYVQLVYGGTALMAGAATACFALGMFLVRYLSGLLIPQRRHFHLVIFCGVFGTVLVMILPLLNSEILTRWIAVYPQLNLINGDWFFYLLLLLIGGCSAPFWPIVQNYTTIRLPHLDSTMIFVLLSCAGVPGCALFTWLMGWVGNVYGMRTALLLAAFCYLTMVLLLLIDRFSKNFQETTKIDSEI